MSETSGRTVFRRFCLGGFEYRSDIIAHDYMRRWCLSTPWGSIRVHQILRSDKDRHLHDHPFDFVSLILRGGYIEHRTDGRRMFLPGMIVARRAEALHSLTLLERDAWTLVIASPLRRSWGFSTEHGWIAAENYDAYLASLKTSIARKASNA